MRAASESPVVERLDDGEKEKKKKRRSNRRSKQTSASSECSGNSRTPTHAAALSNDHSLKQQEIKICSPDEHGLSRASNVSFTSMPPVHFNERQMDPLDLQNIQPNGGGVCSKSCSEPVGLSATYKNKDLVPSGQTGTCVQRNYYSPHWSMEAVEKALEVKGDVFKSLFRVNAHNRLEAYCKIDGVPTDVLISGIPAQNRAVDGDTVAVKIDPLALWTKMKGSNGAGNVTAPVEDSNLLTEDNEVEGNISVQIGKVDADSEFANYSNCLGRAKEDVNHDTTSYGSNPYPEKKGLNNNYASPVSTSPLDLLEPVTHDGHDAASDNLNISSYSAQGEVINAVENMCLLVNSFPSKRPTGRVVAIVERSPRRECIIGHLNVKSAFSFRDMCRKDAKKNKKMGSGCEYIQLMPTDPKFPKMTLLVRDLPNSIKKRLQSGDATLEMDLVAARIGNWSQESPCPQAHILHIFGRGGEIQPQLDAILFENAVCVSEFSPEALSCLPYVSWEVPQKEFQNRMDLRNLCALTIDPSTASDLDDALSIEKLSNGNFRVGIHIADVSYFVLPNTTIDNEAQSRSTSVYVVQRKLSMLPPSFSENIGSLNPGVDRLAVSMLLDINLDGDVLDRWIGRTVIKSSCKLSYEHAQDIIDGVFDVECLNTIGDHYPKVHGHFGWPDVITSVKNLYEISRVLKNKRFNDGALRLESPKLVILFDEDGIPYDSMLSERKESNFLVEEFMLLANRTAAEVICRAYPDAALLRRHPEPNLRKLRELEAFCNKHGLELDTSSSGRLHWSLEKIREKLKGDPTLCDILISYATRPMQLAQYFSSGDLKDKQNDWAHYALAVSAYTHFTSPLRRYPDIIVHRMLLAVVEAEEMYLEHKKTLQVNKGEEVQERCFTGMNFGKEAAESVEGKKVLSASALKHGVPSTELLVDVAAYCNARKLASRNVKDACDKLYMWVLLKKKEVLLSEARILGLGPRFMSIYVQRLAIERRIYYDEIPGLNAEWLDVTSTLVLSMCTDKRAFRRGSPGKWRAFEEVVFLSCPSRDGINECDAVKMGDTDLSSRSDSSGTEIDPAVFPLTLRLLATVPVALHAVGGDDGPLDIGVRLFMSSYLR
ncbi:DIS3-like exonuclease 2 isoform X2 [Neltuma alba]|uniref:DIS3-like exonuclease 2 isoform X2 n=1 Tax=Neltuma alba TaxID=207710 RepID=UPI0010A495E8|nr:DIS3-like exonuclease 2 isoform X2 [Prosopis alba]